MEDVDEIRSSNCSNDLLLYCDEDPFAAEDDSSPPPPAAAAAIVAGGGSSGVLIGSDDAVDELMREYKAKERCFAPATDGGYLRRLLLHEHEREHHHCGGEEGPSSVSSARSKAIHYIIYAFGRLGLAAATAFNAANYLDRFLAINCHLSWELWMVEVVSVACLSVACKLDEVNIPSLHHLQMEEVMRHSFRASTVRDMELTLLKALQWRLACVTPYSYLLILLPTASPARSLCTRLLLRCLSEPSFLRFDASVVAAAALRCTTAVDHAANCLIIPAPLCTQLDDDEAEEECFKMMKKLAPLELDTSSCSCLHQDDRHYTTDNTTSTNQLQGIISSTPPISVLDPFQNPTDASSTVHNRSSSAVDSRRRRLFGA